MNRNNALTATLVWLILILTFLSRADSSMIQSNSPLFAHALGARLAEVGLVTSVYAVVTLLVRFGYSASVPLAKIPRIMTWGFMFLVVSVLIMLLSEDFWQLLVGVGLSGVSTALVMPHLLSLMGGLSTPDQRERNLSYYSLALSSSLVVAPIIGTLMLTRFPLRSLYVLLLVFAILALVAMIWYQPALTLHLSQGINSAPKIGLRDTMRDLWRNRIYMNSFWALFLFNLSFAAAMTYGGVDIKQHFHLPYVMVELVLTSFFVVSLLGRLLIARFARKGQLTKKATLIFWALGVGALGLVLMGWSPNLPVFITGFWLLGWPHAALFPLITMRIASNVGKSQLVAANTLAQSSFNLSGTFGPLVLGIVAEYGSLGLGFWIIALLQLVAMGVVYWETRDERRLASMGQQAG
ncbi:MAG: MFS transporter [Firmicutes bacterium]|nr:MFS transporter [Bacillota bacterium]